MKFYCSLITVFFFMVWIENSQAHHSPRATYTEEIITIEGYVARFEFKNPHSVIFVDVMDENGNTTEWMTEGPPAALLRRRGWTRDSLQTGQYVQIQGEATRNGSPMVGWRTTLDKMLELNAADGAFVRMIDEESAKNSSNTPTVFRGPDTEDRLPLLLDDGRPNFSGTWTGGASTTRSSRTRAPFNERGLALQEAYHPANDPSVNCEAPGLVRKATSFHPIEITQYDDRVLLHYEEYGETREIYLNRPRDLDNQLSNLGNAAARYDGDSLIIETVNLLGNLTSGRGNALSDQTTTIETYRRGDEESGGSSLRMTMVINDPGHLSEPWTATWQKYYQADYQFIENECFVPLKE